MKEREADLNTQESDSAREVKWIRTRQTVKTAGKKRKEQVKQEKPQEKKTYKIKQDATDSNPVDKICDRFPDKQL